MLNEWARRQRHADLVDHNFPKQAAFITDPARLLAGFCTRRAGKSFGVGIKLCQTAMQYPGTSNLYVALTRESAKRILFKDVIQDINHR